MATKYGKKKYKQNNILYTAITAVLLCVVFLTMVSYLYTIAEEDAYETLHVQTKQIKDDITLQLMSDRENLLTMANFAAKLYAEEERYDIMFEAFKPIGLIENIGILNKDNTFVTRAGTLDVGEDFSFEEETKKGAYISTRVNDITTRGKEIVRSVVPIIVDGETVGMLYGVIQLDKIGERYNTMAKELDAQLFVYHKETGDLVIDTVHKKLGNISFLKSRKYNDNYSYKEMISNDKGFTSFMSAYRNENMHLHYSAIDDIGWMIALARYDSQVFAKTNVMSQTLIFALFVMLGVIALYIAIIMSGERRINSVNLYAAEVRKELLETIDGQNNIFDALVLVCKFAKSRSTIFFDSNGDEYKYVSPKSQSVELLKNERQYFKTELFRYAAENYDLSKMNLGVMTIKPNKHLLRTNPEFYEFLKQHKITDISFAAITNSANHITILGTVNSRNPKATRILAEKVVTCFSMALYNKNHINETEIAATTDSLTGVLNRVSYKNDIEAIDQEKPFDFSCIYIDVNELHICNNKYGHAAGDEMLLYIANSLKENFAGHKIYRIGGDEFLVFAKNTDAETIKKKLADFEEQIEKRSYHVAVGMSFRTHNTDTLDIVREAEVRMYEEKALYYQEKEQKRSTVSSSKEYVQIKTGILEIDTILSILKESYNGIYRVSLDTDKARRILMPAYLNYNENEEHFSNLFSRYVSEAVDPDYHRAMTSFMNYDVIRRQLADGKNPVIRYKKSNGETVILSVYKLCSDNETVSDTLWVFAKE